VVVFPLTATTIPPSPIRAPRQPRAYSYFPSCSLLAAPRFVPSTLATQRRALRGITRRTRVAVIYALPCSRAKCTRAREAERARAPRSASAHGIMVRVASLNDSADADDIGRACHCGGSYTLIEHRTSDLIGQ